MKLRCQICGRPCHSSICPKCLKKADSRQNVKAASQPHSLLPTNADFFETVDHGYYNNWAQCNNTSSQNTPQQAHITKGSDNLNYSKLHDLILNKRSYKKYSFSISKKSSFIYFRPLKLLSRDPQNGCKLRINVFHPDVEKAIEPIFENIKEHHLISKIIKTKLLGNHDRYGNQAQVTIYLQAIREKILIEPNNLWLLVEQLDAILKKENIRPAKNKLPSDVKTVSRFCTFRNDGLIILDHFICKSCSSLLDKKSSQISEYYVSARYVGRNYNPDNRIVPFKNIIEESERNKPFIPKDHFDAFEVPRYNNAKFVVALTCTLWSSFKHYYYNIYLNQNGNPIKDILRVNEVLCRSGWFVSLKEKYNGTPNINIPEDIKNHPIVYITSRKLSSLNHPFELPLYILYWMHDYELKNIWGFPPPPTIVKKTSVLCSVIEDVGEKIVLMLESYNNTQRTLGAQGKTNTQMHPEKRALIELLNFMRVVFSLIATGGSFLEGRPSLFEYREYEKFFTQKIL